MEFMAGILMSIIMMITGLGIFMLMLEEKRSKALQKNIAKNNEIVRKQNILINDLISELNK